MLITPTLHCFFKSLQTVNISVGYAIDEQIANAYTLHEAMQLSVSVYGTNIRPTAKISAVLLNSWQRDGVTTRQQTWTKQLYLAERHEDMVGFTTSITEAALVRYVEGDLIIVGAPQVAVVIDGAWQEDPMQWGQHNFNFTWMMRRPSVARR